MTADATGEPVMIDGQRFVIVDLRIPFFRLVMFFIKAGLAAIPAAIVVGFLLILTAALIAAILGDHGFVTRYRTF
jgi:hypothetical protein